MAKSADAFHGEIKVASRIIDYLSSGLYQTPAACLKELINNSYDADARLVSVFVKPDADRIIIDDDGEGMSRQEFVRHFDRVSESHKRDKQDVTKSGRPKIGKIGIGFIAANEICDSIEIFSTKRGSSELLHVTINFAEMRRDIADRRRGEGEVAKGDYEGVIESCPKEAHYTRLFLRQIRGNAQSILASARRQHGEGRARSLYGLSLESVAKQLGDPTLESWSEFDAYSENLLRVALNPPIRYLPGWLPKPAHRYVAHFEQKLDELDFTLRFDGAEVRKPVMFRQAERYLVSPFRLAGKHVGAEGYFYAQRYALKPQDLNGLLVRIRHAAAGEYDPSFWQFPSDEATLFQRWTSAEIWADDRLEEALNIDRRTIRVTHPAFIELQAAVHDKLSDFFKNVRSELYATPAGERRRDSAERETRAVRDLLAAEDTPLTNQGRSELSQLWRGGASDPRSQRVILRKFTVSQLFALVIAVAKEVLDKRDAARFIEALIRRLRG